MEKIKNKIGIMGTHGVGKTTFAKDLATDFGAVLIGETARTCSLPINRNTSEEAQRLIWLRQTIRELQVSTTGVPFICDRTALDPLVYAAVAGLEEVVDEYLPATLAWMETYSVIYWLRPAPGLLVDDGVRDTDPAFQAEVDKCFEEWIRTFAIPVVEKRMTVSPEIEKRSETPRRCRICGCTDNDCTECIAAQGFPCSWVEEDLCSRCRDELEKAELKKEM